MKITVGIPFYNNEKTLDLAIKSVIYQVFQDWELILIDDGSVDSSLEIAKKWVKLDNRVTLISDGMNRGLVYRLNQIIDLARGELIARMDADDLMLPERLELRHNIFVNFPETDIVASAAYTIDDCDNPVGIRDTEAICFKDKKSILKKALLIHPSILVRKEWFLLNKYNKNYIRAEDFELWCRTFEYTRFYRIEKPLLLYREGNVNINNYILTMKTMRKIYREYSKGIFSNFELSLEILKTYLKIVLYRFFGYFKLQHLLTSLRNKSLSKFEIDYVNSVIRSLKNRN